MLIRIIENKQSSFNLKSASFSKFTFSTSWLAEYVFTVIAGNNGLSMTEYNSGLIASSTLDIHEVGVGSRH